MLKKKDICCQNISNKNIFICPYCGNVLKIKNYSLVCDNNHLFDISRKGEIFLIKTNKYKESEIYDKDLFIHRRSFISNDFYEDIYDIVANVINNIYKKNINVLDLGCGEGTHAINIIKKIVKDYYLIGIDYSKSGIALATDYLNDKQLFFVADINNLPLKSKSIDVVIDFLSPYNTNELNRVLTDDGIVIKICPGRDYLIELKNKSYDNENEVRENILKNFNVIDIINYKRKFFINNDQLDDLINMTPMLNDKLEKNIDKITIDMLVYILNIKK